MKMTGMMIVTTIETGFRIALRISRQAIANVALASRSMPGPDARRRPPSARAATTVGAHAASSELASELDVRLFEAGLVDPEDAERRPDPADQGLGRVALVGAPGRGRSGRWRARGRGARSSASSAVAVDGVEHDRALEQLALHVVGRARSSRSGRGRRRTRGRPPRPPRGSGWSGTPSCRPRCGRRAGSATAPLRLTGSRPDVGSSRNRIPGRCMRLRMISSLRFMPPE